MRIRIFSIGIVQGRAVELRDEDGPYTHIKLNLMAYADDGKMYIFQHEFDSQYAAGQLGGKVLARGSIDLELWDEYIPGPSYSLGEVPEEDLMDDEERAMRFGRMH